MDYGLLQGLGEGLQAGVGAYGAAEDRKMRQRQVDEENRRKADERNMMLADKGLMQNETGKYEKTPELKAKNAADSLLEQQKKESEIDKNFFEANQVREKDASGNVVRIRGMTPMELMQKQAAKAPYESPLDTQYKQAQMRHMDAENAKLYAETNKSTAPQTIDTKLKALNATDKARYDNARMGLNAINNLDAALASGARTYSLVGDNSFTQARNLWEEAIGRMQSGGAINKEEAARFRALAPTTGDTPEIRAQKLAQMRYEMGARLKTLGINENEIDEGKYQLAYDPSKQKQGLLDNPAGLLQGLLGSKTATAAPKTLNNEDQQAIEWAKANKNTPEAQNILQMHGVR